MMLITSSATVSMSPALQGEVTLCLWIAFEFEDKRNKATLEVYSETTSTKRPNFTLSILAADSLETGRVESNIYVYSKACKHTPSPTVQLHGLLDSKPKKFKFGQTTGRIVKVCLKLEGTSTRIFAVCVRLTVQGPAENIDRLSKKLNGKSKSSKAHALSERTATSGVFWCSVHPHQERTCDGHFCRGKCGRGIISSGECGGSRSLTKPLSMLFVYATPTVKKRVIID
jgi:hypothetical protein